VNNIQKRIEKKAEDAKRWIDENAFTYVMHKKRLPIVKSEKYGTVYYRFGGKYSNNKYTAIRQSPERYHFYDKEVFGEVERY